MTLELSTCIRMKSLINRHPDCLQEWFLYVDNIPVIELKGLDGRLFMGAYPATKTKILGKQNKCLIQLIQFSRKSTKFKFLMSFHNVILSGL